jgi:exodeoxyribonuclease V beta subunit
METKNPPLAAYKSPLHGIQLIEASAGTGKTWTLSALFARLIVEKKQSVEQILAITFTKAAAAELRDRIRRRLVELSYHLDEQIVKADDYQPDEFCLYIGERYHSFAQRQQAKDLLHSAIVNFDQATITTINGFCQGVLVEQALASGMPLESELISDLSPLIHDIIYDYCRQQWRKSEPLLVHYFLSHDEFSINELSKFVTTLLSQSQALIKTDSFDVSLSTAIFRKTQRMFDQTQAVWHQQETTIRTLFADNPTILSRYSPYLESRFEKVNQAFATNVLAVLDSKTIEALQWFSRETLDEKRSAASIKKDVYFPAHPFFDHIQELIAAVEKCKNQLSYHAKAFQYALVVHTKKTLLERLYAQQAQSFDMQIKGLAHALTLPETGVLLAQNLRERYPSALVDEFQDTDNYQYEILKQVYIQPQARHCALFLVGDPKQAIYRFRGADVYTYLNAYKDVSPNNRHHLAQNQRSVSPLIGALNRFFKLNSDAFKQQSISYQAVSVGSRPHAPLLDKREIAQHNYQALRLWYLPLSSLEDSSKNTGKDGKPSVSKTLCNTWAINVVVNEIVRLLTGAAQGDVCLGERKLEGKDIVILVRSHFEAESFRKTLASVGIKAAMQSRNKVFSTDEAAEMARVLAAFSDPHNEGKVRAVLASRLCGATVSDFIKWQADTKAWTERLVRFQDYYQLWQQRGFIVAWRDFLYQENVISRLAHLAQGERIITNFLHLADLLHEEYRQRVGMHQLCDWLGAQRQAPQDSENAELRLESDENLVKIMTIHQSKGLEFPIVFVPSLWSPSSSKKGVPFYHQNESSTFDLSVSLAPEIQQQVKDEILREDLRLGYVALTRASQRCYVLWCPLNSKDKDVLITVEQSALGHWLPQGELSIKQLAEQAPNDIGVHTPTAQSSAVFQPYSHSSSQLTVLTPPFIARGYRLTSFSSLNHGAQHHSQEDSLEIKDDEGKPLFLDHEEDIAFARFNFAGKTVAAKNVGNCLHKIFEHADFTQPLSEWHENIQNQLKAYGIIATWQADVMQWLSEVMLAPLTPTLTLQQLRPQNTLRELDFHLPLQRFYPPQLIDCLRKYGLTVPDLMAQNITGFMKGSIDLIFEHQGQYFIADYKSNHLGHHLNDYQAEKLQLAMANNGYQLQAALYSLALHRWLTHRLQGYQFEQHFGGVFYLFIRGMNPQGNQGIYEWRPSYELLMELNAIIGEQQ